MKERAPQPTAQFSWDCEVSSQIGNDTSALLFRTNDGDMEGIYHSVANSRAAVIWVGGAGGGLDGPARGLYPAAAEILQGNGISSLRLDYRYPYDLYHCILDVAVGVQFLTEDGVHSVALVGHSFGGAVVISAAAQIEAVKAVVPMSTQTYGTELARKVAPRPMLLIHGTADEILPHACSEDVYRRAGEPKELRLFQGARHGLDESREDILSLLTSWLPAKLTSR